MTRAGNQHEFERAVVLARNGHAAGFEYLWHRFSRPVVSFARLRGSVDPEGIANDTFAAAFRSLDRFAGDEDAFVAFVFAIARNKAVDESRKRSRRVAERPWRTHDAASVVAGDAYVGLSSETQAALARLTEAQREVLFLRIVADLPLHQVAALIGRSIGATKAMQHRALAALRKEISREAVSK